MGVNEVYLQLSCDAIVFSFSYCDTSAVKMAHLLHAIVIASILPLCLYGILSKQKVVNCAVLVKTDCYYSDMDQLSQDTCFDSLTDALGYVQQCHCTTVQVYVQSNVVLESGFDINDISAFTLQGIKYPKIQCTSNESNIVFSGVGMNVTVSNLTFVDCNVNNGTLQFVNHHHYIHIQNVVMRRSTLVFIDTTGHVVMENSTITNIMHTPSTSVSGLYIRSSLSSKESSLIIELNSCYFTDNNAGLKDRKMRPTRGAGVFIDFKHATNYNYVKIASSVFMNNTAYIGGGMSILTNVATNTSFQIHNSIFQQNKAFIGSAMDMYCSLSSVYTHRTENCLKMLINNSNFTDNKPLTDIVQEYSATVSTRNVQLQLAGQVIFFNNMGSAIMTLESDVFNNGNISFIENEAQHGGGLNLISSFVTLGKNTEILFRSNRAVISGGAIYSNQREDVYISYSNSCFIRYINPAIDPDHWNTTVRFEDNSALNGMTIFTTSVQPCMLKGSENSSEIDDMKAVFCGWKSWVFKDNNCHLEVATSPQHFELEEYVLNTIISGLPIPYYNLKLAVFDELRHNVTNHTLFTMLPSDTNPSLIIAPNYDGSIVVFGEGLKTEKWYIHTIGERTITASMTITMQPCPPGFVYKASIKDCMCTERLSYVHCLANKVAVIEVGNCMSYLDDDEDKTMLVYGRCIFSTVTGSMSPYIPLPHDATQFCALFNRRGLLCGNCIANYSIDVFSDVFVCEDCTSSTLDWCIYFIVESLPVFILFSVIIMLHISLTSGPVNGYIFYSQVITLTMEVIFIKTALEKSSAKHPILLTNILIIPANFLSLDFFRIYKLFTDRITCLGSGLTVVHLMALRYLSAIYPLIFLVIAHISIELHARNCCYIVRIWRPISCFLSRFRQSWNIRTSVVDGFAAFILLSYVKIIRVSILLTTYNEVYDKNGTVIMNVLHYDPTIPYLSSEHIPFMFLGTLLLLTFGLFFPLLLILYQFAFLQKCLNALNLNWNGLRMFMDAFQGCYKDGKNNGPDRRYFAGLYFVFRIIVFYTYNLWDNNDVYVILESFMIAFALLTAILRPYKEDIFNYIDTFFFSLLGVVYGLHMYIFDNLTDLTVPNRAIYTVYALELIPFIYLLCFMSVWYGKRIINHKRCQKISIFDTIDTSISWRSTDEINLLASERDNMDHRFRSSSSIIAQSTMLRDSAS